MKHLFVINPMAYQVKGRVPSVINAITAFFSDNSHMSHEIHVMRWERDAAGFIRRYGMHTDTLLRVHVMGGGGTLFEAVNALIGLPNVQLAAYPYGQHNEFLRYFGKERLHLFASIRSQVFSDVTAIDAVKSGNNYGINYCTVGLESVTGHDGLQMFRKHPHIPKDICYQWATVSRLLRREPIHRFYKVNLDSSVLDGEYATILAANGPCYGSNLSPALEAHPNDGILDIYLVKAVSKRKLITGYRDYVTGNHQKLGPLVLHRRGKRISIETDEVICVNVDSEFFYENNAVFEVAPYAIDFVCPSGIHMDKIPKIYKR
jgi:diacylglycerol kinase family enzyme